MKKITYVAVVSVLGVLGVSSAHGEVVTVGDISREVTKTLPDLGVTDQRDVSKASTGARSEGTHKAEGKRFIEDTVLDMPEDDALASPITQVVVSSDLLKKEITEIVKGQALHKTKINRKDLGSVQQKIWDLGLKNKKLLHAKFKVVPNPKENGNSWLVVGIKEIVVRKVNVVSDDDVRQAVLDDIQREASQEFYQEKILDLNELDNPPETDDCGDAST